jgi:hypothetical protein
VAPVTQATPTADSDPHRRREDRERDCRPCPEPPAGRRAASGA